MQTIIKRPSPAFALAFVALFVALTGGAYAVATAPTDSVVSDSIKDREVKTADIGYNAVGYNEIAGNTVMSEKVLDNNLRGQDILDGSLGTADLATDSVGPAALKPNSVGPAEIAPDSVDGDELALKLTTVTGKSATSSYPTRHATATCPAGQIAIGGGAEIDGPLADGLPALSDVRRADERTWRAFAIESEHADDVYDHDWALVVDVHCLDL